MDEQIYRLVLEQGEKIDRLEQKIDRMSDVIMAMAGKMGLNPNARIDEVMAAFDMTPAETPEPAAPFDMTPARTPEQPAPFDMTPEGQKMKF